VRFPGPFFCEKPGTPRVARRSPGVPPLAKAPISSISTDGVWDHALPLLVVSISSANLKRCLRIWWVGLDSRVGDVLVRVSNGCAPRTRLSSNNWIF